MTLETPYPALHWNIFCRVIDNYGDVGVCWRLAVNLGQRGQRVCLWVDDLTALSWMAPQGATSVEVRHWTPSLDLMGVTPGDVLVEAFGCEIAPEFIAAYARQISLTGQKCHWINLEYLSAENYPERCHGLPSPVMRGPGEGLIKHFYYPGFTPATGGLLLESDFLTRQNRFDRTQWLKQHGVDLQGRQLMSLFCYEPTALEQLLDHLACATERTCLAITPGRASKAVQTVISRNNGLHPLWNMRETLSFLYLPKFTQNEFDHLLWACDLNFVRGEDSLVRALWAGKPFVWQAYPQDDGAHAAKLEAFLEWLQAPASLRAFHRTWNGLPGADHSAPERPLPPLNPALWRETALKARERLLHQNDLASSLIQFASKTN